MKQFKSIESHYIPNGVFNSITEFKEKVHDEYLEMVEKKNYYMKKDGVDMDRIPLPLAIYVLYKDLTARKTLIFPRSAMEKKALVIAIKKQMRAYATVNGKPACTEPLYGMLATEIFMSDYQMPDYEELTEAERKKAIAEYTRKFQAGEVERTTRVLIQFENAENHQYDVKLYDIIDPFIASYNAEQSERMTAMFNDPATKDEPKGLMESIFNYSEEEEMDVLGKVEMNIDHFSIREAIEFVKAALKDKPAEYHIPE